MSMARVSTEAYQESRSHSRNPSLAVLPHFHHLPTSFDFTHAQILNSSTSLHFAKVVVDQATLVSTKPAEMLSIVSTEFSHLGTPLYNLDSTHT